MTIASLSAVQWTEQLMRDTQLLFTSVHYIHIHNLFLLLLLIFSFMCSRTLFMGRVCDSTCGRLVFRRAKIEHERKLSNALETN